MWRIMVGGALALSIAGWSSSATAQAPGNQAQLKPVTIEGAIKAVSNNAITVSSGRNQDITVMLAPNSVVAMSGTADPSAVAAGMNISFTAELNGKGEIQGDIAEVTLREAADMSLRPGIFGPEDTGFVKPLRAFKDGSYSVHGKVVGVKDGEISVSAPGVSKLKFKLASDAKINVQLRGAKLAQMGDGIIVEGKQVQAGQVIGENVTVKMMMPYAPKKKGAAGKEPVPTSPFGTP